MDTRHVAMALSLAVALLMLVGKMTAWYITGSNAILSDAAESVVHILATGFAAFSLWYSMQAPDKQHPYGHGKIAYFSAGFEGGLIAVAAFSIFFLAIRSLLFGVELMELRLGLGIVAALAAVNAALGTFLVHVGKRYNSIVLIANGKNVLTDMWTSVGVVLGVFLVWLTGIEWLDPVVALLIGANILYTAFALMKNAFQGLLDRASQENTDRLLHCLRGFVNDRHIDGYHQLRHRQTEDTLWIELHLLMPADMSTLMAHTRITKVEEAIRRLFPDNTVHITSHVEPSAHDHAHPDGHEGPEDPFQEHA